MPFFPCAHTAHPLWRQAVKQVVAQLWAQVSMQKLDAQPCLGVVYVSAAYAPHARQILAMLAAALPAVQHWVGCAGYSVLAGDVDYGHSGALAVMLSYVDGQHYEVFSSVAPKAAARFVPRTALIHGDVSAPESVRKVPGWLASVSGADRMGGLCGLQDSYAQWAWGANAVTHMPSSIGGEGVQVGGLSGVAFAASVDCLVVGMHGCKPVGRSALITKVDGHTVLELDGKPALEVLCQGSQTDVQAQPAMWLAMTPVDSYIATECLARDSLVLSAVDEDWERQGIVLDTPPMLGQTLTRCQPDEQAARTDMRRACAELWEALTTAPLDATSSTRAAALLPVGRSICGAIYVRSHQRVPVPHSPQVDAELQLIRHALGPVPLLGFSSSCEIGAGKLQHLSAQLLVFTQPLQSLS